MRLITLLLFLTTTQTFAIKGTKLIANSFLKSSSCRLELNYQNGKTGICSSSIIGINTLATAKHCLFLNPQKASLNIHSKDNERLALEDIKVYCANQTYKAKSFKMHEASDLAKLELDENINEERIELASLSESKTIAQNPTKYKCSAYGFGLNNDDVMKEFNGVIPNDIKYYHFRESLLMGAIDYDLNAMAMSLANSMFDDILLNQDFFPHYFNQVKRGNANVSSLSDKVKLLNDTLTKLGLGTTAISSKKSGPFYKDLFKSIFTSTYKEAFENFFQEIEAQRSKSGEPNFLIYINVENENQERSGIDSGDSGGAFACYINNNWKLFGINSRRTDSNLMYVPLPWEPMYYQPPSRITKNGEIVPIISDLRSWLLND